MERHGRDSAAVDTGVVREFHPDEGWGVIDAPNVPGGCWVHFSAVAMDGYRQLLPGQRVAFRAEQADQDGFAFRATEVWSAVGDPAPGSLLSSSVAYRSVLTLTFDPSPDTPSPAAAPADAPPPAEPSSTVPLLADPRSDDLPSRFIDKDR